MKKVRLWASVLFLSTVLLVPVIWWIKQGPFYKLTRLDTWLQKIDYGDPAEVPAAKEAVLHLGNRALPRLVWLLKAKDVPLLYRYRQHLQTLLGQRVEEVDLRDLRSWASAGFQTLGAEAVPCLVDLLSDSREEIRSSAAHLIAEMGPAAEAAVPALTDLMRQGDQERVSALFALAHLGSNAQQALPQMVALAKELRASGSNADLPLLIAVVDKIDSSAKTREAVIQEIWTELDAAGRRMEILNPGLAVERRTRPRP
jgi:hypothetical protein